VSIQKIQLIGDVNLLGVADLTRPFARVRDSFRGADVVFANLECSLHDPPPELSAEQEGFYTGRRAGQALVDAGIHVVGNANNVTYGKDAIESSLDELDRLGIAHTGAGRSRAAARSPAIVERNGLRCGFVQRTSIFWPNDHEATGHSTGVAVLKGHTAYSPIMEYNAAATRPGVPPRVITWADPAYLDEHRREVAALRERADFVVVSNHWGYRETVLEYQTQFGHASIDAGADLVFGHGPHTPLPIEIYKGKPIFYGVGSFYFDQGHRGRVHGNWIGLAVSVVLHDKKVEKIAFRFVRRVDGSSIFVDPAEEAAELGSLQRDCERLFGTRLRVEGNEIIVWSAA
jgi:poly-gamma-glutamate capsule biosynthesis protein CapA/YwtB (metallophosphatase superfamily)